ncbi:hypothetical protein HYX13_05355 [Candidatus Woesearchaeota archaeon]|nr:hypothetical protein [Candidatus Woesearchaeota archaeon]
MAQENNKFIDLEAKVKEKADIEEPSSEIEVGIGEIEKETPLDIKVPELELPLLEYSFTEEESLLQLSYGEAPVDYERLWYHSDGEYKGAKSAFAEDENGVTITNDAEADIIPVEEAQQAFEKIQYAALVGTPTEVNFEERRKLSMLFLFQRDIALLLESTMAVTRNVNYTYN